MWWFIKKKSADHALRDLVDQLSKALGGKLISVAIFGSKASGEFREDYSDLNVLLLLENLSWSTLELITNPIRSYVKSGHAMPVLIQKSELQTYANSLPIEFIDLKEHHKILSGHNFLQDFTVDRSNLRAQCAQELSVKQLKIRQSIIMANGNMKRLKDILVGTLPSILTLYRAVLRLETDVPKGGKLAAAQELAKRAGFDGDALTRLSELHVRRQTDNIQDLAEHYLETIEQVQRYINRK